MRLVFVSSTFKDMQFERDALSARVAPRIDTFLSLYGENVHFGDLRWGVNTSEMDDLLVLLAYKYLRDSEREKDKNDPFIQKYFDDFISIVYDMSFKEFKKSFFEIGKAWEEGL